ncbi:MAG: tetratricopeptide repeat protein [Phycisphaerales bacterium]|nr:tetratricopeptide repeat protein [Phycisphaerales bacterium]
MDFRSVPRPNTTAFVDDPRIDVARRLLQSNQFPEAEMVLRTILAKHPDRARARFYLALAIHKQKRYAQARSGFERAIEAGQGFPEIDHAFHFYGWCLYYLGELPAAQAAFEEHVRRVPTEGDSYFGLGLIAIEDDRVQEAITDFKTAIDLQKDNPGRKADVAKCHARLGDVYLRLDRVEEAGDEYLAAVTLYPNHYEAWAKRARVLSRLGREQEAKSALREQEAAMRRVGRLPEGESLPPAESSPDAPPEPSSDPLSDPSAPPTEGADGDGGGGAASMEQP